MRAEHTEYGEGRGSMTFSEKSFTSHVLEDMVKRAKSQDDICVELDGFNGGSYSLEDLRSAQRVLNAAVDSVVNALINRRR